MQGPEAIGTPNLHLYHYGESLCSQKVRVALLEKQLAFESHEIALCDVSPACENLTPEYLAVNPRGSVPTLIHDGEKVFDSYEIIRHLDEAFPDRGERLWPDDETLRDELARWIVEGSLRDDVELGASLGNAIPMVSAPVLRRAIKRQPLLSFARRMIRHPVPERRYLFLAMRVLGTGATHSLTKKGLPALARGLVRVDRRLDESGGPWLLGPFSQIDIALMACFHRLEDVGLGEVLCEGPLGHVRFYWERLKTRPSYAQGIEEWHQAELREVMKELFADGNPALPDLRSAIRSAIENPEHRPPTSAPRHGRRR